MKLRLQLENKDYLAYHLYNSSKSSLHKKKRMRGRIVIPILFLILGSLFILTSKNLNAFLIYVAIAVFWFLLHPLYSRWLYKNHFRKHIKETYKNRVHKTAELTFKDDSVLIEEPTSETKIFTTEFQELIELPDYYFLKLKSDVSIIFPKSTIANRTAFKRYFQNHQIRCTDELNWRWS